MIARALMHDPKVLLLDEPTTGLDPQARRLLWETLRGLHQRGLTFILTTHYMEEADRLCQRLAIVDHGKILTLDTPGGAQELAARRRRSWTCGCARRSRSPRGCARLAGVLNIEPVEAGDGRATASSGCGSSWTRPTACSTACSRRVRDGGRRPAPRQPDAAEPRGRLHPPHRAGAARMTAFLALLRRDLVVASRNARPAAPADPHPADPRDPRLRQHPAAPRPRAPDSSGR